MSGRYEAIPGVRLKIRTDDGNIIATIWIDEEPRLELLRAPLSEIGPAGGDLHHAFVDLAGKLLESTISRRTGLEIKGLRRKPSYRGEITG